MLVLSPRAGNNTPVERWHGEQRSWVEILEGICFFFLEQAQCSGLGVTFPAGLLEKARFPFRTLIIRSGAVI
jgi:hypothetical protein